MGTSRIVLGFMLAIGLARPAVQMPDPLLERIRRASRENLLTVPAEIDGSPLTLVFDTGAAASVVIDTRAAEQRHLTVGKTGRASGAGNGVCPVRTLQSTVVVAQRKVAGLKFVAPLDHLSRFVGIPIVGVAGGNLLSAVVAIDVTHRVVSVGGSPLAGSQPGDRAVTLDTSHRACCIVPAILRVGSSNIAGRFIIDTGAPGFGVILGRKLAQQYSRALPPPGHALEVPGLCGTTRLALLPSGLLRIGDIEVPVDVYASLDESGAFTSDSFDALIGGEALHQLGTVIIDGPAHKIVIRRNSGR